MLTPLIYSHTGCTGPVTGNSVSWSLWPDGTGWHLYDCVVLEGSVWDLHPDLSDAPKTLCLRLVLQSSCPVPVSAVSHRTLPLTGDASKSKLCLLGHLLQLGFCWIFQECVHVCALTHACSCVCGSTPSPRGPF